MSIKNILRTSAAVALVAAAVPAAAQVAPTYAISGSTAGGFTFDRPSATNGGLSGFRTAYNTFTFSPLTAGGYDFLLTSTTAGYDPFLALYAGSFDAASPLANLVAANDDLSVGNLLQSGFSRTLAANTNYTAVITGFNAADFGNYSFTITPAATAAVPETATWAMMLLGFGMAGAGMRYRRRGAAVRFA